MLPAKTNQLLLNFAGQLKFLMSKLITRHPLFPNIADTAEFVDSFSQLSVNDKETSGKDKVGENFPKHSSLVTFFIITFLLGLASISYPHVS